MNGKSSKEAEAAGEKQPMAGSSTSEAGDNEEGERSIMQIFAEETTFPGLPRVILAKSRMSRYFWLAICLTCAISFGVGIVELLQRYFRYEKKVTVEMVSEPVPFPHITLCNMRSLDFDVLNKINNMFLEDPQVLSFLSKPTGDPFIDAYVKFVATFSSMYFDSGVADNKELVEALNEALSRLTLFAEIPKNAIEGAGIQIEQYVARCQMGNVPCNLTRDFHRFFNQFYFNCYTYDPMATLVSSAHEDEEEIQLPWLAPGLDNGVSMIVLTGSGMLNASVNVEAKIIPGIYDMDSAIAGADGVRVVIHSPDVVPFPLAEGFDVPPGFSVSFGVRPRRNVRIGPPHGDCVSKDPFGTTHKAGSTNAKSRPYRQMVCQKQCIQKIVKDECGCYDENLLGDPSQLGSDFNTSLLCHATDHFPKTCIDTVSKECFDALLLQFHRIRCSEGIRDRVRTSPRLLESCGCRAPCNELVYDVSYSLSRWPAAGYEGDSVYNELFISSAGPLFFNKFSSSPSKHKIVNEYFNESKPNRIDALRDFARINVYVADPEVIVTTESEDYDIAQLVSDIGGQLGVWIGLSVITAAEVVELVLQIIERKRKRQRQQAAEKATANS